MVPRMGEGRKTYAAVSLRVVVKIKVLSPAVIFRAAASPQARVCETSAVSGRVPEQSMEYCVQEAFSACEVGILVLGWAGGEKSRAKEGAEDGQHGPGRHHGQDGSRRARWMRSHEADMATRAELVRGRGATGDAGGSWYGLGWRGGGALDDGYAKRRGRLRRLTGGGARSRKR
nr:hypothetical protein CFP56_52511 [Quercus suber]